MIGFRIAYKKMRALAARPIPAFLARGILAGVIDKLVGVGCTEIDAFALWDEIALMFNVEH